MGDEISGHAVESLRLPKGWRSSVRNAVLKVIGMLTGREALINNGDAEDARIHQLESEVAMLREELRLNGARIQRVPSHRPHMTLDGKTPNDVYFSREPANERLRIKPRKDWPRGAPCAKPQVDIDGEPGDPVIFEIDCLEGRRHLPVIRIRRAA